MNRIALPTHVAAAAILSCSAALAALANDEIAPPGGDRLVLQGGATVVGEIVKRTDGSVWIDVGPQVLEFKVVDIKEIVDGSAPVAATSEDRKRGA